MDKNDYLITIVIIVLALILIAMIVSPIYNKYKKENQTNQTTTEENMTQESKENQTQDTEDNITQESEQNTTQEIINQTLNQTTNQTTNHTTNQTLNQTTYSYLLLEDLTELKSKSQDTNPGVIGMSSKYLFDLIKEDADCLDELPGPFDIEECLLNNAFAYVITEEQSYFDSTLSTMNELAALTSWEDIDGSGGLGLYHTTIAMSLSYNWLYPSLSEEDKNNLKEIITQKGLEKIYDDSQKLRWPFSDPESSNWYIVGSSALGISSLAIYQTESEPKPYLQEAIDNMKLSIEKSGGIDGGYPESIGYGAYALIHFYEFNKALKQEKEIDLLDYDTRNWIEKFNEFMIYSSYPDYSSVVLFNDQKPSQPVESLILCTEIYKGTEIAKKCQSQLKEIYAQKPDDFNIANAFVFLSYDPYHSISSASLLDYKYFRDIGQIFYHNDWNNLNSLFLGFKAETHNNDFFKTNLAHSHSDGGTFVLYKNKNEYIADPGYQFNAPWGHGSSGSTINEFTKTSLGHNTMSFDDLYQKDSFESRIVEQSFEDNVIYIKMDLEDSYPSKFFQHLDDYTREFIFVSNSLFIIDRFVSSDLDDYVFRLQTTKREKTELKKNQVQVNGLNYGIIPYIGDEVLYGKVLYPNSVDITEKTTSIFYSGQDQEVGFIEQTGELVSGVNYLVNVLSFDSVDYEIVDQGDYFSINVDSKQIKAYKSGEIEIV